ncbi:MAG: alanine racemase [bacterium]|nr:alanine racemase [bacterium]
MSISYKTWVEISKSALKNNVNAVRKLLKPETKLMAVVKSNAYGHGPATAGLFLKYGADWLGVDNIDEAIELRRAGIKKPILILGYTPPERINKGRIYDLRFTIYDEGIFNKLTANKPESYKLHLKIDTGMSRQGVPVNDLPKFVKKLPEGFQFEGVFSHFANADNLKDRTYPDFQMSEFDKSLGLLASKGIIPQMRHMAATTALFTMLGSHFDMVRTGIALYGLWASPDFAGKFKKAGIKPVLSWKTRVVQMKKIKKGTPVGYGITERVKKDTKIGILPVGYYDGYNRVLSSRGEVLIDGARCRVIGRMSMNLMVVDISKSGNVKIWDEAVLIGKQGKEHVTAEELAEKSGTISYEIVSRINPLLPRIYI